jgi:hypothetical protein
MGIASSVSVGVAQADIVVGPPEKNTGPDVIRPGIDHVRKQIDGAASAVPSAMKDADKAKHDAGKSVDNALDGGVDTSVDAGSSDAGVDGGPTDAAGDDDVDPSRAERVRRSKERLASELGAMIGDRPIDDTLMTELRAHAETLARLDRIGEIAVSEKDDDAVKRVRALLDRESAHFKSRVIAWRDASH